MTTTDSTDATATIQVKPSTDPRVTALYTEGVKLALYAESRTITSSADVESATRDLVIIAGVKKAIEERRQEYVGPINDHLRTVNNAFKAFTEPLVQADTITHKKVLDYMTEQKRIKQEQERINQLRLEAAQAEMKLTGELSEPVNMVEVAPPPQTRFNTDTGTLGTAKIKKWELTDISQVPIEYLMIDATRVGKVVRAGIPSIPGIRIWEEESLRVTSRKGA
jgi:hypothetical protein